MDDKYSNVKKLLDTSCLTRDEFEKELEKGYEDMKKGNLISAEKMRLELDNKCRL